MPLHPSGNPRAWLRILALAALGGSALGFACGGDPPAWNQELLVNRGFEDGVLAPWLVEYGSCEVEFGPSFPLANARTGDYLFYGGDSGVVSSCRAHQEIDLFAENFKNFHILNGKIEVDGEVWLRRRENAGIAGDLTGDFADQAFYRVRFLDAASQELGSLRTLVSGDDSWELRELTGIVPPGTKTLRAELEARFRLGNENDGLADDASLVLRQSTLSSPTIAKQPFLQDVRQDAMTVLWETTGNFAVHSVEWGLASVGLTGAATKVESTQIDSTHFVHKAVIEGLSAETEYIYRVVSGSTVSPSYVFRTAPLANTPYRVAWFSDNQNGPSVLQGLALDMVGRDPDLVIVPGDIVQNGDQLGDWQNEWFTPMETASLAQTTPVMIARGNHDGEHPYSYAYTALPHNESWYSFTYGNGFFVAMDTEAVVTGSGGDEDPLTFLTQELTSAAAQAAEFKIVYFHRPPYTNLWDATNNFFTCLLGLEYDGEEPVRDWWVPVFEANGVDLVVSGHTHSYQHGVRNGVNYVLVGGAGGNLDTVRGCSGSTFWSFISTELSSHHYNLMDVNGTTLQWAAYDQNDVLMHAFQIVH